LDIKLVYFPFLQTVVLLFIVNLVGHKVKPKHLVWPNFIVMMGMLEHLALIAQVVLSFSYGGSFEFGIVSIIIYLSYIGANIAFTKIFKDKIQKEDKLLT
jgi:hypothetical protein